MREMREERRPRKNCGNGKRKVGQGEGSKVYFFREFVNYVNYVNFGELHSIVAATKTRDQDKYRVVES